MPAAPLHTDLYQFSMAYGYWKQGRSEETAVPADFDAEVLSALGRLQRGGALTVVQVDAALDELRLGEAPPEHLGRRPERRPERG